MNLNYLILSLLQSRIFYSKDTFKYISKNPTKEKINIIDFDFTNSNTKELYNIYLTFYVKVLEKHNFNVADENKYRQYVDIILYFSLKYLVVHEYINIPLLTLLKFLFRSDDLPPEDIAYVNILLNILGEEYVNMIIKNNSIQFVSLLPLKCNKTSTSGLICDNLYFINQHLGTSSSNYP